MRLRTYKGPLNLHEVYLNGYYGRSQVVEWGGLWFALNAGTSDSLDYYIDLDDPDALYVLTSNYAHNYIGVERLHPDYAEPIYRNEDTYQADKTDRYFIQSPDEEKPDGVPLLEMAGHNAIRWIVEKGHSDET